MNRKDREERIGRLKRRFAYEPQGPGREHRETEEKVWRESRTGRDRERERETVLNVELGAGSGGRQSEVRQEVDSGF